MFSGSRILLMIVLGYILSAVLFAMSSSKSSNKQDVIAAFSIGYAFIQIFSLCGSVPIEDYGDGFGIVARYASTIDFNLQFLAIECDAKGFTFFNALLVKLFLPGYLILCIWISAGILFWDRHRGFKLFAYRHAYQIIRSAVSACALLMTIVYTPLTTTILSFVSCTMLENGQWVMDASPDLLCFGKEHMSHITMFIVGLLLYVIGIPVMMYLMIVPGYYKVTHHEKKKCPEWFEACFGFMMSKYTRDEHSWELAVMLRKACLAASFMVWSRSISMKMELAGLVLTGALALQSWKKPYKSRFLNLLEVYSMMIGSCVMLAGLGVFLKTSDEIEGPGGVAALGMLILIVGCSVAYLLYIIVFVVKSLSADLITRSSTSRKASTLEPEEEPEVPSNLNSVDVPPDESDHEITFTSPLLNDTTSDEEEIIIKNLENNA